MTQYLVSLFGQRQKVLLIKTIRAITGMGLKDSKDYVEANFTFDSYMTDTVEFNVTVTVEQLGQLCHFCMLENQHDRMRITATKEITPHVDVFDLTDM